MTEPNRFRFRMYHKDNGIMDYDQKYVLAYIEDQYDEGTVIMQSTGLADKHGKEIFEGDVVTVDPPHPSYKPTLEIIKWGEHQTSGDYYASRAYGWYTENVLGGIDSERSMAQIYQPFAILGNIYENPELLKATVLSYQGTTFVYDNKVRGS